MMKCYPEIKEKEEMRKIIGRYGLTGKQQVGFFSSYIWLIFNQQMSSTYINFFFSFFFFSILGKPY